MFLDAHEKGILASYIYKIVPILGQEISLQFYITSHGRPAPFEIGMNFVGGG